MWIHPCEAFYVCPEIKQLLLFIEAIGFFNIPGWVFVQTGKLFWNLPRSDWIKLKITRLQYPE